MNIFGTLFHDKIFFPDISLTVNNMPDISLTCFKFPEISRFSRQVVSLFIRWLELLFYCLTVENVLFKEFFCNPKNPGLGCYQSGDSGLAKMAAIPGFRMRGMESLITCDCSCCRCRCASTTVFTVSVTSSAECDRFTLSATLPFSSRHSSCCVMKNVLNQK